MIYENASVQIALPSTLVATIQHLSNTLIKDEELYVDENDPTYGRDAHSHVTITTGFREEDLGKITQKLLEQSPVHIELAEPSCFYATKFDVLYIAVKPAETLQKLYEAVLPLRNVDPGYAFTPHCTVAFLKKGHVANVLKNKQWLQSIVGTKCVVNGAEFTHRDGKCTQLLLGGK